MLPLAVLLSDVLPLRYCMITNYQVFVLRYTFVVFCVVRYVTFQHTVRRLMSFFT